MKEPNDIVRLTIADVGEKSLPTCGLYIIAYSGEVIYVGRTDHSIEARLNNHMTRHDDIGDWLWQMRDEWKSVRIDALEPPLDVDAIEWMIEVEKKAIVRYNPLFNTENNPARGYERHE